VRAVSQSSQERGVRSLLRRSGHTFFKVCHWTAHAPPVRLRAGDPVGPILECRCDLELLARLRGRVRGLSRGFGRSGLLGLVVGR
jgi:hypothetical protein